MNLKPDHKKWADLVIKGIPEMDAYFRVYPKAAKKTAQNQIVTFRKNVGLMDYINKATQKIAQIIENKHIEALSVVELSNILTSARKREILAKIVNGEMEVEKYVTVKGELKKVKAKPDLTDIMKAIELDNKMSGDNVQAKPNQVAKAEEVTKVVVVEDETESPKK
jgi:hypothetical protein